MPITSGDDVLIGLSKGPRCRLIKVSANTEGAGTFHSLWKVNGYPAAGSNPPAFSAGAGYTPTKDTTGAAPIFNPTDPEVGYLGLFKGSLSVAGAVFIYDRLWACSGLLTNTASTQTVTTPGNLPSGRDPNNGMDVEPWLEVYSAPGATTATWTMTGTDALGNTNRTWTYTHPANAESVGQMMQMLPGGASPASTLGCRQVTSFACSVSSGSAGDVGLTLLRILDILTVPLASSIVANDAYTTGLPRVYDDACLAFMVQCSAGTTGQFNSFLGVAHK